MRRFISFPFRAWAAIGLIMALCLSGLVHPVLAADAARGQQAMVATVHPLATQAGLQALQAGGNAVDAAVAAALMLGVVDNHNSGIGGGCFILIRKPDGQFLAIDGRETAPAAAHRDMFVRDGQAVPELSQTGPLAVGVPGALAAYDLAVKQGGQLSLARLLNPAARRAEEGFPLDRIFARNLRETAATLRQYAGSRQVLLKEDGSPYAEGEILVQPDLARTYRQIAQQGIGWFYQGPFATAVAEWMAQHGGLLTEKDFRNYRAKLRQPIVTQYRDHQIVGFPPPSSGGVHVAQILNMLERFDLQALHDQDPARFVHVVSEAMKLAFADRAHWLGDADFAPVPRGLLDKQYAAELAQRIELDRVVPVQQHGFPPNWETDLFRRHTTHIAAADRAGYWVAITATVNTSFGSKVIVPGTGVVLNNEMDDFSSQPGVPNVFGLVGAEHNAIQPGKRPLSSMSPTIVLRQDRPVLTLGAAGGPKIITQVVLGIIRTIDLRMPLPEVIAAERFHHQWSPDQLFVGERFPDQRVQRLIRLGHEVVPLESMGVMQAITWSEEDQTFIGVHDPRVPGQAAGLD